MLVKPFNLFERGLYLIYFGLKGYRNIYIHYSYYSVLIAWLMKPVFRFHIYLWDCERYEKPTQNYIQNLAIRLCDTLVTGSPSLAESYQKAFALPNKDIRVVANWVYQNQQVKSLELDPDKYHILFVHHLSPRKGSRVLPQIIRSVSQKIPQVMFHIVGSGPDLSYVKESTKSVKKQVTFYSSLSPTKVIALYKAANLLIVPSKAEGFPRVVLEAMIYKLPLIASDVGNIKEIVGEKQKKFIVPSNKIQLFIDSIQKIYQSDPSKIVNQNYSEARKFNLKTSVNQFVKVFNEY